MFSQDNLQICKLASDIPVRVDGIVTNLMEHFLWINLHAQRLVGLLRSVFLVDIGGARTVNERCEPGLLIASDRVNH